MQQKSEDQRLRLQFGRQLRSLRLAAELTQEVLADRAKISVQYLQNLESPQPKNPSLETLGRLAGALDLHLWELLKFRE